MNLTAGVVLQKGKYTIDSILGQGCFGITYRAIHHQSNQIVALKTFNESLQKHQDFPKFQHQFMSEAHLLAKSIHPNIVRVWDFFEENGLFFIVMDYIPGQNLAELVKCGKNLHPNQAAHYIHQIASALSVVHKNGFLHRDIQPKNIIRRSGTNTVVLTDFGIACDLTSGIRQTHTNLFSVGYSPPEQCNPKHKLSPATDIYALSATLYYLLTGKTPVPAPLRVSKVVPQTLKFSAKELKSLQPNVTPSIENTILMGLKIDAEKRPQTVESWLAFLLNKSSTLDVKKQSNYVTEKLSSFNKKDKFIELLFKSIIHLQKEKKLANKVLKKKLKKINLKLPANMFTFSWINRIYFPFTIFSLFVLTAVISGWIGFDLTMRYSYAKTNNKEESLKSDNILESLKKEQSYTFRNQDPSSPLFDSISVENNSKNPLKLNKLPKPYSIDDDVFLNNSSVSNEDKSSSEKVDYSDDMETQVYPYNYSVDDNSTKVDSTETFYESSDYQPEYPNQENQKYEQQSNYQGNYY